MMVRLSTILLFVSLLLGQSVGFVGNSITASGYGFLVQGYMPEITAYNFGLGGITVGGYDTTGVYQNAINRKTDITIILLGSNDWKVYDAQPDSWDNNWNNEYQTLINTFNQWGDVYVGTIPYRIYIPESDNAMNSMNQRIRNMSNVKNVIDFNYVLGRNPDYFWSDGVHPNDVGKEIMAVAVWTELSKKLGIEEDPYYEEQKPSLLNGCSLKRREQ